MEASVRVKMLEKKRGRAGGVNTCERNTLQVAKPRAFSEN
jgi:hypothetical protein